MDIPDEDRRKIVAWLSELRKGYSAVISDRLRTVTPESLTTAEELTALHAFRDTRVDLDSMITKYSD